MEDGTFRYRKPPKVSWFLEYGHGRPANVIVTAKGLVPVLSINEPEQPNLIVPDIMEIGGIEDLRSRTLFYDAISLGCIHADFQGKRIIALLRKEGSLTLDDENMIQDICRRFRCRPSRIGRWTFACVTEVLFHLRIISKDEYYVLNNLRILRNSLQHQVVAKYTIDSSEADRILKQAIQVLLRLRELPMALATEITGYELKKFWDDLGFKVINS